MPRTIPGPLSITLHAAAPLPGVPSVAVGAGWLRAAAGEVATLEIRTYPRGPGRLYPGAMLVAHLGDGRRAVGCLPGPDAGDRLLAFLRSVPAWRGAAVWPSVHDVHDGRPRARALPTVTI